MNSRYAVLFFFWTVAVAVTAVWSATREGPPQACVVVAPVLPESRVCVLHDYPKQARIARAKEPRVALLVRTGKLAGDVIGIRVFLCDRRGSYGNHVTGSYVTSAARGHHDDIAAVMALTPDNMRHWTAGPLVLVVEAFDKNDQPLHFILRGVSLDVLSEG